ncbi:FAD-binding and (Fe-S)-binding domain-containing protein [Kibdelosporangium phytohabitans]|uniref:Dimethylmenaquinone methyltransferase n=1 Tax=Kibdelosporangium phytohabitans TaxID=860235 RepID=A0A0N9HZ97_9PSEU|nr:FAD-binding and (Fe-S)-binding domain-containing protein [Kibdelosporangium phytohabitans]ALG08757.1 dimethylmenaquinone methyltransferase [Kibdelosporangium phytohabitans]MBE1470125.1 FAD/FMN-containing dehydrogenase/Fe-S oxidoreductase [Kibdelosporangium phytohabitans]
MSTELIDDLRGSVRGGVAADAGTLALYSADASNYRRIPRVVVFPRDRDDVIAAVAACRRHSAPITCRGGGTSTSGQAVGNGVVLDFSRHYNKVLDVDPHAMTAVVQPGVVLDELQAAVAGHGLVFGPDPSTHGRCTIGGMIGNNACGSHSLAWGKTSDNVLSLEVMTYDGTIMTVGPATRAELDAAIARGGESGRILAAVRDLALDGLGTIRTEFGRFPRQVSGYSLEHLLPENRFDLARALVGTEGTCVVVLSATLRLVTRPRQRQLLVLGYSGTFAAADAVPALVACEPMTLEGLDRALTRMVTRPAALDRLPGGDAWLFAEIDSPAAAESLVAAASATAGFRGWHLATDPVDQRALWSIREDGAGLATRLPGGAEAWPGWEDAAVPPENLGAYLREFTELLARYSLRGATYGHFGEGCLHVRLSFDFGTTRGTTEFRRFLGDAARLVAAHGGSPSGEHGDGQARSDLLGLVYSEQAMTLMARFKRIWDPDGLLNPGMVVDARPSDQDLRVSPSRVPLPLPTVFGYPEDDGDFTKAARRCVGVGKCRNMSGSVMCPSYRVTGDERDSTRGRARLLYEMTQGEVITGGWRSAEVRDALDLCLSCKACATDCPVGVDMATYKSEFLHHHYRRRPRPMSHYSMGWLPLWSRLAAGAPRLVNAVTQSAAAPAIKRLGGIAPQRALPRFATRTFLQWFRARPAGSGRPVLLWVDTFNNHFTPHVLRAGVEVLESAGFRVIVPPATRCCGLTWLTTGQLGTARRVMTRTVRTLDRVPDVPIVGMEPSCTVALHTDVPRLLGTPAAHRTAGRVRTFAQLLVEHGYQPPVLAAKSISQTHCHQHADTGTAADAELLGRAGVDNTAIPASCCGLAGNFGFEREHYQVSVAAAEQATLPAVRAAGDDTAVLADGFSCRTQIAQLTGRSALHLAELLAQGVQNGETRHSPSG